MNRQEITDYAVAAAIILGTYAGILAVCAVLSAIRGALS